VTWTEWRITSVEDGAGENGRREHLMVVFCGVGGKGLKRRREGIPKNSCGSTTLPQVVSL